MINICSRIYMPNSFTNSNIFIEIEEWFLQIYMYKLSSFDQLVDVEAEVFGSALTYQLQVE